MLENHVRWRMFGCVCAAICLGSLICFGERFWFARNGSTLMVEPKLLVMKAVPVGQLAEGKFLLRNCLNHSVQIKGLHTSCACTSVHLPKRRLEPGECTPMLVEVRDAGGEGGRVADVAIIWTEKAGEEQVTRIQLQANFRAPFILDRQTLQFVFEFGVLHVKSRKLLLKRGSLELKWDGLQATTKTKGIVVRVQQKDGNEFVVEVMVNPKEVPAGLSTGKVLLQALHSGALVGRPVVLPIEIVRVGHVMVNPSVLYLGAANLGSSITGKVDVMSRSGPFPNAAIITCDIEAPVQWSCGRSDGDDGRQVIVCVSCVRSGSHKEDLLLRVKDGEGDDLFRIPVIWYCK